MRCLVPFVLLCASAPAVAAQGAPVTEFDGGYDLWCDAASLGLNLGLTVTVAGVSESWGWSSSGAVPCAIPVRSMVAWARGLSRDCAAQGLPVAVCDDFARGVFDTVRPFASIGEDVLPAEVVLTTIPSAFSDLIGVYDTQGVHAWADGRQEIWHYWLDNNIGFEGHFVSFGLAAAPASSADGACLGTSVAAIDGWIDRTAGFSLTADYGVNTSLTCGAASTAGGWVGTIGLTFAATMGGQQR